MGAERTLIRALAVMLTPIVRLMLRAGIGYSEFSYVAKGVFVDIAAREYGLRGRPTNSSRVSAITGISRKQVGQIRRQGPTSRWTPDMETSPLNTILHFWHHDPDFCQPRGKPKALSLNGDNSFVALVAKYAGDIPAGAIRASLIQAGSVTEDDSGRLIPRANYYFPTRFSDDFIRGVAFAFGNLGSTLVHNAYLRQERTLTREQQILQSRLERTVWSERLRESDIPEFKDWVRDGAEMFIDQTNHWIGRHELPKGAWSENRPRSVGVGIYYFEEDL